jgi:hypothetical protein
MGYGSQSGRVILRTQTTPGTYNSDTGTAGVAMRLRSGALGSNRDLLIPDAEIGGGRDVSDGYMGAVSWSGDYEFYARIDSFLTLAKACLGTAAAPVTATGVTTHTITPSDSSALPFLSIEERISSGLEVFNYNDAVVNTLHLEADANGYLMGTAGLIGARQVAGATPTPDGTVLWDTTPMYVGTNITVTYNSVTLPAKSFSLDINNNFEDDDFRLGSFYLGDLTPKRREITASFGIRHADHNLWRQAVYGTPSATQPGGLVTKADLTIQINAYEDIVGGTPATKYSLKLEIPKFALKPFSFAPSGDDVLENDVEGQALRPDPAVPSLTVTGKTAKASIS